MLAERITSRANERVKAARALDSAKGRRESGRFLIEGEKLVWEAVSSGMALDEVFLEEGAPLPDCLPETALVRPVTRAVLEAVTDCATPQRLAATVRLPETTPPARFPEGLLLICDRLQDPGNLGTILRAADAMGACGALLSPDTADPYAPKAIRAAMGSTFHLPVWQGPLQPALDALAAQGYLLLAGHLKGEETLPALGKRVALVVGNEGAGVSDAVAARCALYRLHMPGRAESLNASVAAGILLYELSRGMGR